MLSEKPNMKNLALKYPSLTVLITFFIICIGGSLLGFISGLLIIWMNPCDPCDGAARAAVMIWSLSFKASVVIGGIAGVLVFVILHRIVKQQQGN